MKFSVAVDRPFHAQLTVNMAVSILIMVVLPILNESGGFGSLRQIIVLVALATVWRIIVVTKSDTVLLIAHYVGIFSLSVGFRTEIDLMGGLGDYWRATAAGMILMSSALLFDRPHLYLANAGLVLWVFYAGVGSDYFSTVTFKNWLVATIGSLMVGCMINVVITKAYQRMTQMKETYRLMSSYRQLSQADPLTGLSNRRAFEKRLSEALRMQTPGLHLVMLDIDDFKLINDSFGHDRGDAVLSELGVQMISHFPDEGAARLGGEEFAVLLPAHSLERAQARTQALLDAVREAGADQIKFTFSAGVAVAQAEDDSAALMKRADEALYAAKKRGKDRVVTSVDMRAGPDRRQRSAPTAVQTSD